MPFSQAAASLFGVGSLLISFERLDNKVSHRHIILCHGMVRCQCGKWVGDKFWGGAVFFVRAFGWGGGNFPPWTFESPPNNSKISFVFGYSSHFLSPAKQFPPKTTSLEKNPWEKDMLWSCLQHWTGNGEQQQTGVSPLKLCSEPFSGVFTSPDSCSAIVVAIIIYLFFVFVCLFVLWQFAVSGKRCTNNVLWYFTTC